MPRHRTTAAADPPAGDGEPSAPPRRVVPATQVGLVAAAVGPAGPYFVMEFADGGSLADRWAGEPQPPRPAAELVATVTRAVHAAHRAGIVHRDLKPGNVLLVRVSGSGGGPAELVPKVSDFGLARRLDADGPTLTGP